MQINEMKIRIDMMGGNILETKSQLLEQIEKLKAQLKEAENEMTNLLIARATCSDEDFREMICKLEEKYMN